MIDQRYRKVSFGTAVTDFFKGSVDYSGFTSRAGHWFPVGLIYLVFAGSSFPAEFTTWIWLTFILLIASAFAISKALTIKKQYLDKVIGNEENSKQNNATTE